MIKDLILTILEVGIIVIPLSLGLYYLFKSSSSYEESYNNSKLRFWGISKRKYKLLFRLLGVFCLSVSATAVYSNYFAPNENVESEIKDFWKDVDSSEKNGISVGAMLLGAAIAIPT